MPDLFDNPAGLDGFEFIEFTAPTKGVLEPIFEPTFHDSSHGFRPAKQF